MRIYQNCLRSWRGLTPTRAPLLAAAVLACLALPAVSQPKPSGSSTPQGTSRAAPGKPAPPAVPPPAEAGVWFDDTGKGAVEIRRCGADGAAQQLLCGNIVWLKEPTGQNGQPLTDGYNPDPDMRARPICGLQVLGDLAPQADGAWDEGWVYDPKVGKAYNVEVRLEGRDRLNVTGYKGIKLLGKSFVWTRAPPTLPRCADAR